MHALFFSRFVAQCQIVQKLGDFGLATQLEAPFFEVTTFCGTPNYLSPYATRYLLESPPSLHFY